MAQLVELKTITVIDGRYVVEQSKCPPELVRRRLYHLARKGKVIAHQVTQTRG